MLRSVQRLLWMEHLHIYFIIIVIILIMIIIIINNLLSISYYNAPKKITAFFKVPTEKKTLETMTPVEHHANVSRKITVTLIYAAWCATGVMVFGFLLTKNWKKI